MTHRPARSLLCGTMLVALTALSAGCSTMGSDFDVATYNHDVRHPILISNEPETMDMPVGMSGPALSHDLEVALRDYVHEYRADGTGSITIQVPTGSANEVAAASTGRAVHYALVRAGMPRNRIQVAPYEVGDHAKVAPLRLSYLRVKAVTPSCGVWPEKSPDRFDNGEYHDFGCATRQNLAAMVANPADLVRPRQMAPADGNRRADVISKYRRGEDTQSNVVLIGSAIGDN